LVLAEPAGSLPRVHHLLLQLGIEKTAVLFLVEGPAGQVPMHLILLVMLVPLNEIGFDKC
jgi:hypothetical protein